MRSKGVKLNPNVLEDNDSEQEIKDDQNKTLKAFKGK